MCGIFAYTGKAKQAQNLVFNGLKNLEYRGYDSWGIAAIANDNKIQVVKKTGKIGNSAINNIDSTMAIGHTRWATHGGVTVKNAHPHLDCTGSLALIHNGIIENYDQIKNSLLKSGHRFLSETDSEVAVHLIEEYQKKLGFEEAVIAAFKEFQGLNAIIVMNADARVFAAAKNGSPLIVGKGRGENFLASDAHALLPYTRNIYFMEDGEAVFVDDKKISVYTLSDYQQKSVNFTTLDWRQDKTDRGHYPHYMIKEIHDQVKILEYITGHQDEGIKKFSDLISKSFGTYLVGCGTAAYASLAGTYIFSKIAKFHLNFSVASEFGYLVDFLTEKSLVIALSQSGETIDLIDAVRKAKKKGARIAALVNNLGSTLYRSADYKLLLNAGVEKAVVSTKAFTAKLAHLILIAYNLAGKLEEGKKVIRESVAAASRILEYDYQKKVKNLADKLANQDHIYIIGRGVSYPVALETALKIKEASYIHAEGFAGGELKHGVIALISKGTPCMAILADDETYSDTLSGVMEMKARGGYMIGLGSNNQQIFDEFLQIPDCGIATVIPNIIIGQLIGYYLAVKKGLDPDKPRNLAKSVTVK